MAFLIAIPRTKGWPICLVYFKKVQVWLTPTPSFTRPKFSQTDLNLTDSSLLLHLTFDVRPAFQLMKRTIPATWAPLGGLITHEGDITELVSNVFSPAKNFYNFLALIFWNFRLLLSLRNFGGRRRKFAMTCTKTCLVVFSWGWALKILPNSGQIPEGNFKDLLVLEEEKRVLLLSELAFCFWIFPSRCLKCYLSRTERESYILRNRPFWPILSFPIASQSGNPDHL